VRSQDREAIAVPPTHPAFGAITSPDGEPIGAAHADAAFRSVQAPKDLTRGLVGRTVADVERDLILDTLGHCLGNRTHAAKVLGISIRTLRNKLNEYGAAGAAVPESGQARIATAWDEAAVSPAFL